MISPFGSSEITIVTSIVLFVELVSLLLATISMFEHRRIEERYTHLLSTIGQSEKAMFRSKPLPWIYLVTTFTAVFLSTALYLWSPSVIR